ncbi:MAG: dTDP-4-dehydrorhamnose reductase [Pseudomonadota bacterium]
MGAPILLLGKDGQVGYELQRALPLLGPVVAVGRAECDLADLDAVRALVRRVAPGAIVNAAAYTAVDKAESDTAAAERINAGLPGLLAEEAAARDAWLLHYSTDYVFDGSSERAWSENDPTAPLGAYGRSKRAGEAAVQALAPRHLVLRTSWVFGAHGGNFLKTMLRLGRQRDTLNVVADQWGAPTGAALIADVSAHALKAVLAVQGDPAAAGGLYHLASAGETSWHGYARFIMAEAARLGADMRCTPEAVLPIPASAYPLPAPRPANSRLDTTALRARFGLALPGWQAQVTRVLETLLSKDTT